MRDFVRSITPNWLLKQYRKFKKKQTRRSLEGQKERNEGYTKDTLLSQLSAAGIHNGDNVLVHSALSKIGYVIGGPQAVVDALLETVGEDGNVLMPNSPNASYQLDYIRTLSCFDVDKDKSKLGAITEVFRNHPEAMRSCHPTEPVSCVGPDAAYFVGGHFGEETPYTKNSPFYKVAEKEGKILMIGVTLDNAGTNLHTLEDEISDFKYPVYYPELFEINVKLPDGNRRSMKTRVHDPEWSKKRKCDDLIPLFEKYGALEHIKIGDADALLIDARKMLDTMIYLYRKYEVTMYDLGTYPNN
jgi:aminoglycoside 3-N-acetyltransferase